jgi:hypothetical protein
MIERFSEQGEVCPASGWDNLGPRHQGHSEWRMDAGDPVEKFPGGPVLQLNVDDGDLDLAVTQAIQGISHSRGAEGRVVSGADRRLVGVSDHRVVFCD